ERLVWVIAPVLARIAPILAYPSLHIYDFWQWCGIAVQIAASWRKLQTDWRAKIRKQHKSPDISAIQLLELRYLDSSFSIRSLRFTQKRRVRSVNSRVILWSIKLNARRCLHHSPGHDSNSWPKFASTYQT